MIQTTTSKFFEQVGKRQIFCTSNAKPIFDDLCSFTNSNNHEHICRLPVVFYQYIAEYGKLLLDFTHQKIQDFIPEIDQVNNR